MAQTFTGRKRVRKVFGHVKEVGEMPNLIEVQKASYDQFLIMRAPKGGRANEGLQSVFNPCSRFRISRKRLSWNSSNTNMNCRNTTSTSAASAG